MSTVLNLNEYTPQNSNRHLTGELLQKANRVPIEYEECAYWACRISIIGLLLWTFAVIKILV